METTIIPFSTLPACATRCGHLYDANGACAPAGTPISDVGALDRCFCSQSVVRPFSTGVSGVCDDACVGPEAAGITTIQSWFASFCNAANGQPAATPTPGSTAGAGAGAGTSKSGGGWISNHWQWVIMLVILVVGITGIWIGACIWRRRYIARRDRQHALGKSAVARGSWGAGAPPSGSDSTTTPGPGQFMPNGAAAAEPGEGEKPAWKKWTSTFGRRT